MTKPRTVEVRMLNTALYKRFLTDLDLRLNDTVVCDLDGSPQLGIVKKISTATCNNTDWIISKVEPRKKRHLSRSERIHDVISTGRVHLPNETLYVNGKIVRLLNRVLVGNWSDNCWLATIMEDLTGDRLSSGTELVVKTEDLQDVAWIQFHKGAKVQSMLSTGAPFTGTVVAFDDPRNEVICISDKIDKYAPANGRIRYGYKPHELTILGE